MVEVGDPGMQAQECLSTFPSSEPLLASFLSSCGSMFLLNHFVTPGHGDDLLVVDIIQARDLSDRGSVTTELVRMNDLWDIVFSQQPGEEGLCSFGIPMSLKENDEHGFVLVHSPPKPVGNPIYARTHLVQMPPRTPSGFPVT